MDPKTPPPHRARAVVSAGRTRNAVLRVARMLPERPPFPALAGIKISFLGHRVRFEAGDYSRAGFADVPARRPTAWTEQILVDGRTLARVIRRAPGDVLALTALDGKLVIDSRRWTTQLLSMPIEDYPAGWHELYYGEPADEYDERVYGNSAVGAKPVQPDARDQSLRTESLVPPEMWKSPGFKRRPFTPEPFQAGDWLAYTDAWGQPRIAQVWVAASARRPGTLLLSTPEQDERQIRTFTVSVRRREIRAAYAQEERHYPGEDEPRTIRCALRRTQLATDNTDGPAADESAVPMAA
jgi:DNA polymerase III beta subunit, N-terminal domain